MIISEDKKERIYQIIFQSYNFLRQFTLYDSILCKFNINEYKLINLNLFPKINKRLINKNNNESETNNLLENICSKLLFLDNLYGRNNIIVKDLSYMFYGC